MSERPRDGAGNKGQKQKVMAAASKIWQHKAGGKWWCEVGLKRTSEETSKSCAGKEEEVEQEEQEQGGRVFIIKNKTKKNVNCKCIVIDARFFIFPLARRKENDSSRSEIHCHFARLQESSSKRIILYFLRNRH